MALAFELARLQDVCAAAIRQRQHHQLLEVGRQVRRRGGKEFALESGQLPVLGAPHREGAIGSEQDAGQYPLRRHLDDLLLGQSAVLVEDEVQHDVRHRLAVPVLRRPGPVRHDGDSALADELDVGAAGQILGVRRGPEHEASEVEAVEAADTSAGADVEVGVEVPYHLAVADDALADAGRQGAFVSIAAVTVEGDGDGRAVAVGRQLQRLPAAGPGPVEQSAGGGVNAAGFVEGGGLRFEDGENVGATGAHAGSVGHQNRRREGHPVSHDGISRTTDPQRESLRAWGSSEAAPGTLGVAADLPSGGQP